jgi:hypothetical protein
MGTVAPTIVFLMGLAAVPCHSSQQGEGTSGQPDPLISRFTESSRQITSLPVETLQGKPLDIANKPGWKVAYFWSAVCPCVTACENYSLVPLAKEYAGKVTFYAVDAGSYDLAKPVDVLKQEAAAHRLPYAVVLDRTHATVKALDAQVTPECYLINPDNHIVYSGMPDDSKRFLMQTGKRGYTQSYLAVAIDEALHGLPVSQHRTQLEGCIIAW